MQTILTPAELAMLKELAAANPHIHLDYGVRGTLTCDGWGLRIDGCGMIHPKAAIDILLDEPMEVIDCLKREV